MVLPDEQVVGDPYGEVCQDDTQESRGCIASLTRNASGVFEFDAKRRRRSASDGNWQTFSTVKEELSESTGHNNLYHRKRKHTAYILLVTREEKTSIWGVYG